MGNRVGLLLWLFVGVLALAEPGGALRDQAKEFPNLFLPASERGKSYAQIDANLLDQAHDALEELMYSRLKRLTLVVVDPQTQELKKVRLFDEIQKRFGAKHPHAELIPMAGLLRSLRGNIYVDLHRAWLENPNFDPIREMKAMAKSKDDVNMWEVRGIASDIDIGVRGDDSQSLRDGITDLINSVETKLSLRYDGPYKALLLGWADIGSFDQKMRRAADEGGMAHDWLGMDMKRGKFVNPARVSDLSRRLTAGFTQYLPGTGKSPKQTERGKRIFLESPEVRLEDEQLFRQEVQELIDYLKRGGRLDDRTLLQVTKAERNHHFGGGGNALYRSAPGSLEALLLELNNTIRRTHGGTHFVREFADEFPLEARSGDKAKRLNGLPSGLVLTTRELAQRYNQGSMVTYHATNTVAALATVRGGLYLSRPATPTTDAQGTAAFGRGVYTNFNELKARQSAQGGADFVIPLEMKGDDRANVLVWDDKVANDPFLLDAANRARAQGRDLFELLAREHGIDLIYSAESGHLLVQNGAALHRPSSVRELVDARGLNIVSLMHDYYNGVRSAEIDLQGLKTAAAEYIRYLPLFAALGHELEIDDKTMNDWILRGAELAKLPKPQAKPHERESRAAKAQLLRIQETLQWRLQSFANEQEYLKELPAALKAFREEYVAAWDAHAAVLARASHLAPDAVVGHLVQRAEQEYQLRKGKFVLASSLKDFETRLNAIPHEPAGYEAMKAALIGFETRYRALWREHGSVTGMDPALSPETAMVGAAQIAARNFVDASGQAEVKRLRASPDAMDLESVDTINALMKSLPFAPPEAEVEAMVRGRAQAVLRDHLMQSAQALLGQAVQPTPSSETIARVFGTPGRPDSSALDRMGKMAASLPGGTKRFQQEVLGYVLDEISQPRKITLHAWVEVLRRLIGDVPGMEEALKSTEIRARLRSVVPAFVQNRRKDIDASLNSHSGDRYYHLLAAYEHRQAAELFVPIAMLAGPVDESTGALISELLEVTRGDAWKKIDGELGGLIARQIRTHFGAPEGATNASALLPGLHGIAPREAVLLAQNKDFRRVGLPERIVELAPVLRSFPWVLNTPEVRAAVESELGASWPAEQNFVRIPLLSAGPELAPELVRAGVYRRPVVAVILKLLAGLYTKNQFNGWMLRYLLANLRDPQVGPQFSSLLAVLREAPRSLPGFDFMLQDLAKEIRRARGLATAVDEREQVLAALRLIEESRLGNGEVLMEALMAVDHALRRGGPFPELTDRLQRAIDVNTTSRTKDLTSEERGWLGYLSERPKNETVRKIAATLSSLRPIEGEHWQRAPRPWRDPAGPIYYCSDALRYVGAKVGRAVLPRWK